MDIMVMILGFVGIGCLILACLGFMVCMITLIFLLIKAAIFGWD